jgi:hypothetical protein
LGRPSWPSDQFYGVPVAAGDGVGVGELLALGLGLGVIPLGTIDGKGDRTSLGDGDGEGEGVGGGATHSVPGKYSSLSELPGEALEVGDGEAEAEGDGATLVLFWQAVPSTNPLGRWKLSGLKFAWLRPLLMKSRSTELPTMVPKTPCMFWSPGPVWPTQAPMTRLGA